MSYFGSIICDDHPISIKNQALVCLPICVHHADINIFHKMQLLVEYFRTLLIFLILIFLILSSSWKHTRVRLRLRSSPRLRLRFGDKTHWVRHDLPVM